MEVSPDTHVVMEIHCPRMTFNPAVKVLKDIKMQKKEIEGVECYTRALEKFQSQVHNEN